MLCRFDAIATAIQKRYVVWIEDLERFSGGQVGAESAGEAEKLAPIRALLVALDRLESVTVVTATTSLYSRFDVEKIARFVEELRPLKSRTLRPVMAGIRTYCLSFEYIRPVEREQARLDNLQVDSSSQVGIVRTGYLGPGIHSLDEAVLVMCSTPRVIKGALRETVETWERMRGEIDFDDLLIMSIMKASVPSAFALVREHSDALRASDSNLLSSSGEGWREKWSEKWKGSLRGLGLPPRVEGAVQCVVSAVFSPGRLQGVYSSVHADYWYRYLTEPTIPPEESDQDLLRVLCDGEVNDVLHLLDTPYGASGAVWFSGSMSSDRHLLLLGALVEWSLDRRSDKRNCYRTVSKMWREAQGGERLDAGLLQATVVDALSRCVDEWLGLVPVIEQCFIRGEFFSGGDGLSGGDVRGIVRDRICRNTAQLPAFLGEALRGAPEWTLSQIVLGDRSDIEGSLEAFSTWSRFRSTLLNQVDSDPESLIPQIAGLVVASVHHFDATRSKYVYSTRLARRLFAQPGVVFSVFVRYSRELWPGNEAVHAVFNALEDGVRV